MISTVELTTANCARLHGRSAKFCQCRKPNEAGWHECPREARHVLRGVQPPISATRPATARLSGDICTDCGGVSMVRTGTCMTCQDCGSTSGGCS